MPESMKSARLVQRIGTHDGTFHCDEALACFLLRSLPAFADAAVLRTRQPQLLAECDVVVDVGGEFEPQRHRYDHHQRGFEHTMASLGILPFQTKLSSAGLVYAHFGREAIRALLAPVTVPDQDLTLLFKKMYEKFVEEVDAVDNGIAQTDGVPRYAVTTTLASRVASLNPAWNAKEPRGSDELFEQAMALTGGEFTERLRYYAESWLPARDAVLQAVRGRHSVDPSGAVVLLDRGGLPWKDHLFTIEEELNIPNKTGLGTPQGFESRLPLPAAWRGLRDEALSEEIGLPGAIFAHPSGFIGGHQSKEGALQVTASRLHPAVLRRYRQLLLQD